MKYLYILIFLCFLLTIYFFYNIFFNSKYFYNKHIRHNYRAICKPDHNHYNCKKLKNNYKIKIFNNFLTDKECSFFINYGKNKLEYSKVREYNSDVLSNDRTSKNTWVDLNYNEITKKISKKVSEITNTPQINQENIQLLKYNIGDYYKCHYDNCLIKKDCEDDTKNYGLRLYTFFIYLNDVEKGGDTFFPNLGLKFKPKKGMAILFQNTLEKKDIHPCSFHEGTPPISGEKWAINIWIRSKKYQDENQFTNFFKKLIN